MLQWIDELRLGDAVIDEQHIDLITVANSFLAAIDEGIGQEELSTMMSYLEQHVKTHFSTEEKFMMGKAFPGYENHCNEHLKIAADIGAYRSIMNTRGVSQSFAEDLHEWLEECITHHLFFVDKAFRDYMATRK